MKNIIKTTAYSAVALSSVAFSKLNTFADLYGKDKTDVYRNGAKGASIYETLDSILKYLLTFTALIATVFAIYGGFQILTAGGDDDKVKKGKTTLINALIGLFVILIAWTLVDWAFDASTDSIGAGA